MVNPVRRDQHASHQKVAAALYKVGPDQQSARQMVATMLYKAGMVAWKAFREARQELAVLGKKLHLQRLKRHEEIKVDELNRRV